MQARKLSPDDYTYGMVTQNVGGLASYTKQLPQLFQGFREQQRNGLNDLVLIQETHLDESESLYAEQQYKTVWGYKSSAQTVASFWAPAHAGERNDRARHGGVAILINPHGAIRDAIPWQKHLWTAYRQFIRCSLQGVELLVMNLYAPSDPKSRKNFFKELSTVQVPENIKLVVSGDFNCVTDRNFDRRTNARTGDAGRRILQEWLEKMHLVDSMDDLKPTSDDPVTRNRFASNHHT